MGRLETTRRTPAAGHHPNNRTNANLVTYRFRGKMVYVTAAPSYEVRLVSIVSLASAEQWRTQKAVEFAKVLFREDLRDVDDSCISFYVTVNAPTGIQSVQISPMAWKEVTTTLVRYEIIDVIVEPQVVIHEADTPPNYLDVVSKERTPEVARARSTTPDPERSRTAAAAGRREKALSWIEKRLM